MPSIWGKYVFCFVLVGKRSRLESGEQMALKNVPQARLMGLINCLPKAACFLLRPQAQNTERAG